jgi:excisionase family DNA binding protein
MQHEMVQEKLLLKVEEAGRMLSLGRAKAYQMAQNGEMPGIVRMGRSVRVSAAVLRKWVDQQSGGNVAA